MLNVKVNMKASTELEAWTIGQLAARFGIETHVLRHWEDEGLLSPARDSNGYRRYEHADAVRVATILHERSLGIPLREIRILLWGEPQQRHATLFRHRDAIDAQIAALETARRMTDHVLECRAHDVAECKTFQGYVSDVLTGEQPPRSLEEQLLANPKLAAKKPAIES